jgi:hypothetical protein
MPAGWGYKDIRMTAVSQHQARVSATGIIVAKFIEMAEGNPEPMYESINQLMRGDADLIGGCLLTIVNLFCMFVSDNGQNMGQFKEMCDYLIKTLADDTKEVQRLTN